MSDSAGSILDAHTPRLWAIVGATGTGKSMLALDLAERITRLAGEGVNAQIVNADAMQLYRGMDVGTAKLPLAARRGVLHHMLDVLDVREEASVAAYQAQARSQIEDILGRGDQAILVGGSGLYVSSVLYEFTFPGTDPQIRARLESELEQTGPGALYRRIEDLDPETAAQLDPSNGRRLVRALEVIELTGSAAAARLPESPTPWREATVLRCESNRAELVARLDERVHQMWRDGLVDEVERLIQFGFDEGSTARQAIGYAQARSQIAGEISREEAIERTQALTRTYARRQVNWFSRYRDAIPVDVSADQDPLARVLPVG